ncbi:MAG TPA: tetratricopeptide repeat protein [Rectinemataceae bacterium]|nr:tetratricopeptide repeat protein [Rectinemataceae bacterium]
MLQILRRLFHREATPEPGSLVEELWAVELSAAGGARVGGARVGGAKSGAGSGNRFLEVAEAYYSAHFGEAGLELELKRKSLFAWTEAPLYRQADFVLEGGFAIRPGSPYSACGFLFRYQDEDNFYSALVSTKGLFRLDVVFNGSPRPLVAWTELPRTGLASATQGAADGAAAAGGAAAPEAALRSFALRVIARGSHFSILVDDLWVAEAVDETFRQGHIAFAAQNYEERDAAKALLSSCLVDSRPMEVETSYYRWNFYIEPESAARFRLAQTYFAMGEQLAAAIQLRKIEKRRALLPDELFLKAEVALRLELYDDAQAALDACLEAEPDRREAVEEKANLLYLRSRYDELEAWLESIRPSIEDNARLADLSGHARFALGDFAGAAAEYRRAAELEPEQALFRMNEARAWDQARRRAEAADAYLAAARLFFRQEADDDLALALHRLAALRPRSQEVRELRAKTLFRAGKKAEAGKLLADLAQKGSEDSAVHYLLGILESEKGRREEALRLFERAAELENEYPLYAFRVAETRFLLGLDCAEALERALALAPADGWTLNLAGQTALAAGDLAGARLRLEAARAALPGAAEPAINLAELESREGRPDEAIAALEAFDEDAAARNEAGNVYAAKALRLGDAEAEAVFERAAREYERACRIEPGRAEYQANLASVYMRLERYSEAEERIRRALDVGGESRAFLLAGDLGAVFGDTARAETAYRLGLELAPADPALLTALGRSYLSRREFGKAEEILRRLETAAPEAAAAFAGQFEAATTDLLSCATCGRSWKVPKDLPPQSGSSVRAMPPDDSPAGACPSCGKIYCIACRKESLVDNRFTCPECGESLKLSDNRLRYLVREHLKRDKAAESAARG